MSLNTANTPDGRGVLIYNGEMILLFIKEVNLSFEKSTQLDFKGKKQGNLYLTSHRIIFINTEAGNFRSFSMPFHCLRGVKLEQPIFGANYLQGEVLAQPDGGWEGQAIWKLTFNRGGCIDFGTALLRANDMANNYRPQNAPPPYAPPPNTYYAPPPEYYTPAGGMYNGFQAPVHAFPDQPPAGSVFMYDQPPPYSGIGPDRPHPNIYPHISQQQGSTAPPYPAQQGQGPPSYDQATALPQKS